MRRETIVFVVYGVAGLVCQASAWVLFAAAHHPRPGIGDVWLDGVMALFLTGVLIWLTISRSSVWTLALTALSDLAVILLTFSQLYWNNGTAHNFGSGLTHTSAFYFAVGTLITAGTGNLAAQTDAARLMQTVQMLSDFGFISVALTVLLAQVASRISPSKQR